MEEKNNKKITLKKIVYYFGLVFFCVVYINFIISLIIWGKVGSFFVGVLLTTVLALIYFSVYKRVFKTK